MGLDARSRSKAAREVWERADKHTREALGFSILAVVRDNPTLVKARGVEHRHPDGVLHLTQFTQVAMATLGVAQVAELRESGAFVEGSYLAGHSVGEYNALTAVAGVLPLEALLEVVFQRGSAMHELVPRDGAGRSDYRMAAIRPSQIGVADDELQAFVGGVAEATGEFLQIVNLNLKGSQYAIAGTVKGLEALEREIDIRREAFGGKRAFILVPGIDVPFHSTVLRGGVDDFRAKLDELLPQDIDPSLLIGRYIPNLVPRLFNLGRDFVQEIADLVPSEQLQAVLADFDSWSERPVALTRVILVELLAWQFASPVRWIETQDLLFTDEADGGLGVERFVEIGLGATPTVANLASQTLKLDEHANTKVEVLNIEREASIVYSTDVDPAPVEDDEPVESAAPAAAPAAAAPVAAPAAPTGGPRPDDIAFKAADATKVLIALWTKLRPDQIGPADTIEALCDGVSSRRNQLLVDLGSELSLGAIDGAADADMGSLAVTVDRLARTYKPFGPVLSDSIGDHLRKVFGPSGKRPAAIADRVKKVWELGDGWATHVTAEVALGTRDGSSVRGGAMGGLHEGAVADGAAVDALVDAAVQAVASRRGVAVSMPAAGGGAGGTVDAAALGEFTEAITGRNGVLASAARLVLEQLGFSESAAAAVAADDTALVDLVSAELGSDWPRLVAPAFDAKKAVLIDDRWATAREDLARGWTGEIDLTVERFDGAGAAVAAHAQWWQQRATAEGRTTLAELYGRIAKVAVAPIEETGQYTGEIAVVTGASKGSIAASVAGKLLGGGATVVVTTSRLDSDRLGFYRKLYAANARAGAALWVVPANMASYSDVDALVEWVGNVQTETAGGAKKLVKEAMTPTMLFPFAAPRVAGELSDAGARAEMEMRVLLWSVERLIGGLSQIGYDRDVDTHLHVVLPGSPNRGLFGGDGAYGESKAALDAVVGRWSAERTWAERVTLVHALIGWVRGTGLMGGNDPMVEAVEAKGVRTWSTDEMATELLLSCTPEVKRAAADAPRLVDLTGGLAEVDLDLPALAKEAAEAAELRAGEDEASKDANSIAALPAPPRIVDALDAPSWPELDVDPADLVVIVGVGELGPYGSARTRFEMEVDEQLSAAGVLELAWNTGMVAWENDPKPGWYDVESGDLVPEEEIAERYHDAVVERCGIRTYGDEGAMVDNTAPLLTSVFIDKDLSFVVGSEAEARAFVDSDPENTVAAVDPESGDWTVTRKAGTEIRVPRKVKLTRTVGGQIPTGFDVTKWGIPADMAGSVDRVGLWNIVTTVDAFPHRRLHPVRAAALGAPGVRRQHAGHGHGRHDVDALAVHRHTARRVPRERHPAGGPAERHCGARRAVVRRRLRRDGAPGRGVRHGRGLRRGGRRQDQARQGKLVVAGGFDDLGIEGIVGFGDMSATAKSDEMAAKGIADNRFSRANDRRRGGFVESAGGGTILLARGDLALEMGLPVLGVVAWAGSFADGVHTSIPAPGIGALGAGRGGQDSQLALSLNALGITADDISVVSKHDTSTAANDPNEAELHERLAAALAAARVPRCSSSRRRRSPVTPRWRGGVPADRPVPGPRPGRHPAEPQPGLRRRQDGRVLAPGVAADPAALRERVRAQGRPADQPRLRHVSGLIAVVHPQAFVESIPADQREAYLAQAQQRTIDGQRRLASAMCGGEALYERPADRRFGGDAVPAKAARQLEADMLLTEEARLGTDHVYRAGKPGCQ